MIKSLTLPCLIWRFYLRDISPVIRITESYLLLLQFFSNDTLLYHSTKYARIWVFSDPNFPVSWHILPSIFEFSFYQRSFHIPKILWSILICILIFLNIFERLLNQTIRWLPLMFVISTIQVTSVCLVMLISFHDRLIQDTW